MLSILQSAFGLAAFIFIAWLASEDRRSPPWRVILAGVLLQVAQAVLLIK